VRLPDPQGDGWLDGRRVPLDRITLAIDDPALAAGLGGFETIAVRGGALLDLDAHLERLARTAERLGLDLPGHERLRGVALEAAAAEPAQCAWLKIVVTGGGRWLVFTGTMDPAEEGRPATAVLLPWRLNPRDPLAGMKTLNYAHGVLGLREARRRGADEGIWLNVRGHLVEACSSNLFVVRRRKLFVPGVRDGALPGTVRARVLEAARARGVVVHEGKVRVERLRRADEAFLTSSLRGLRPLVAFEGRPVGDGETGPLTRLLTADVARLRQVTPEDGRVEGRRSATRPPRAASTEGDG
jgi:branched-chain amino acid aminotransferase